MLTVRHSLEPALQRHTSAAPRLLWLNPDRAAFSGLLGPSRERRLGGYALYFSLRGAHRVRLGDGSWQRCELSLVPPYVPHTVESDVRGMGSLMLEAETIDAQQLLLRLPCDGLAVQGAAGVLPMRQALRTLLQQLQSGECSTAQFDALFFGTALQPPVLDPRLQAVLDSLRADPRTALPALCCARNLSLSQSRFLHLFSQQVGVPFRRFKAWKRARVFLSYARTDMTLTAVAMDVGYPDASHLSHTIRQVFGMTPRSILAGSRRQALFMAAFWP